MPDTGAPAAARRPTRKRAAATATEQPDSDRVVGAERVLAILIELAHHPEGVTLDELAQRVDGPKPTVHRALNTLRKVGLAAQQRRGQYLLGDEFLRLAFQHSERRDVNRRVEPVMRELSALTGETTHYSVLKGTEVVYQAKVDPPTGAVRLTSTIGGRNPAHSTAAGKLLLSYHVSTQAELRALVGDGELERRTANTITDIPALLTELRRIRKNGYATDDQENEFGVNCASVPLFLDRSDSPSGALSVSGLTFRCPLASLVARLPDIQSAVGTWLTPAR
jgi:DNA-binding IclR family transcriptional regulator